MKSEAARKYLYIAWMMSLVATCGSLFLSEVLHWQPCTLCWFQRIFMYPQVILLGMAGFRNDLTIWRYSLPLSGIGVLFSIYHYLVQHVPALAPYTPCTTGGPSCELTYLNLLGFITVPFLAGVSFFNIIFCMWMVRRATVSQAATSVTISAGASLQ